MLSDILNNIAEIVGQKPSDTVGRNTLLGYVNRAARELYETNDLPGCLRESEFCIDDSTGLITLPWYVDGIRGIRFVDSGEPIRVLNVRSQYSYRQVTQPLYSFRVVRRTPLEVTLSAAGTVSFVIAEAQTSAFSVTITGQTTDATLAVENLVFAPGETAKTTAKQYMQDSPLGITALTKSAVTTCDVLVKQTSDLAQIAVIPNRLFEARNQLVQLYYENTPITFSDDCVQVLYKLPFMPLHYDYDSFFNSNLEDALAWKVQEHWFARQNDPERAQMAMLASAKVIDVVRRTAQNQESQEELTVHVAPNPYELRRAGGIRYP